MNNMNVEVEGKRKHYYYQMSNVFLVLLFKQFKYNDVFLYCEACHGFVLKRDDFKGNVEMHLCLSRDRQHTVLMSHIISLFNLNKAHYFCK